MSQEQILTHLRPYCHWLLLAIPLLMPVAVWLMGYWPAPLAAALPLLVLFVLLPLADWLLGHESHNFSEARSTWVERRLLPLMCVPVQYALVIWGVAQALSLPVATAVVWVISMGVIGGILAINVAHELIHRRNKLDRAAGGLLLASVNYAGFKVEHLRSHHLYVATPKDRSTAQLNQSIYHFVFSALLHNPVSAWRLETRRLQRQGLPWWHPQNELLRWYAVSLALAIGLWLWLGAMAVAVFLLQGAIAAATLEVINYIEHYGLRRRKLDNGRYEPPNERHSWNSDYFLSNALLLQLQRHADHHANPQRPFPYLRHQPEAPQLPLGYAAMFPLALVPPLWRRVMNPRVHALSTVDKSPRTRNNSAPSRP
ncbi:MAG: alkane 1-monooxygenase AlkB2 [Wenzhouxiangellaceae bacterium]